MSIRPTREDIRRAFSAKDYNRGMEYYRAGRVQDYRERSDWGDLTADCVVQGSRPYQVSFLVMERGIACNCTCPRFETSGSCKHVVAALLACADRLGGRDSSGGARILDRYLQRTETAGPKARLVPRLECTPGMEEYPRVSFLVGYDKTYVVKNIPNFLRAVAEGATVSYGKNLTLCHRISQFDETSQKLIALVRSTVATYQGVLGWSYSASSVRTDLQFSGDTFDRFFDLYQGQQVELTQTKDTILLEESDPPATLHLQSMGASVRVELENACGLSAFGAGEYLYIVEEGILHRCTRAYTRDMGPLLEGGEPVLWFTKQELPGFCACVMPVIEPYVEVDDPEGLLSQFAPDPCTPCFYFDLPGEKLTARLTYRYGETEVPWDREPEKTKKIKRDLPREQQARQLLENRFRFDGEEKRHVLEGDEAIFDFLSQELDRFREQGEVYVSDRLQSRQFHPSAASVGISVSDGLLRLELDTGGFPPEELEALYRSMLQRRKFHKLADGRFLTLDGSACEALAEATHMMQLQPKELTEGTVTVPAFRALYLDSVLGKREDLRVSRDSQFRTMIRKFKTVEDSDFNPPASMDGVLRPYQRTGFRWLKTLESCGFGGILADEMGLGKTLQLITFLATVPRREVGLPSLIVCPASLVLNWADEFRRFAPEHRVLLLLGPARERAALMDADTDSDVWVTSYDLLKRDTELYAKREFYCCALDEGQFIKNQATKASRAVKLIRCRQRFVLTGTPIENRLSELWNLFDFLMPGYLFTHNRFVEKLERPIAQKQDPEAQQQLSKLVRPFLLRRLKSDVLKELPPKLEHVRRVQLSPEERKLYLAATAAAKGAFAGGEKLQILAALTRLRQICCDPDLCFENYEGPHSKLEACLELCAGMTENGHQILVFSQFTSMLERIRRGLEEQGISSFTLQGSTSKERRAELVRRFQQGEASVFLISLKAGGTGLNLTAADVVIHYDPWWNLAAQSQATDRAHRIGQRACVQVYKLIAEGSIEEKILELQARKGELMDVVSANGEGGGILSMSQEELLALLEE